MIRIGRTKQILIVVSLFAFIPQLGTPFLKSATLEILIFSLGTLGLYLLVSQVGLVSMGHSAYIGIGAYSAAIASSIIGPDIVPVACISLLVTVLAAMLFGVIATRTKGVQFTLLSLAFTQVLFAIAMRWSAITGGSDGLIMSMLDLSLLGNTFDLSVDHSFYFLVLSIILCALLYVDWLERSIYGLTFRATKQNELQMITYGYNTSRLKILAIVISSAFAAISGLLLAMFHQYVSPEFLYWTFSGELLMMVVIGGLVSPIHAILGTALVKATGNYLSGYTNRWQLFLGIMFVALVWLRYIVDTKQIGSKLSTVARNFGRRVTR